MLTRAARSVSLPPSPGPASTPRGGSRSGSPPPLRPATPSAAARAYRHLVPAWALYLAAGALAVSRPYLGVHYPSDVLAGAALGTAVADLWPGIDSAGARG
jgi:membrane-associated phospholipid phosphatase